MHQTCMRTRIGHAIKLEPVAQMLVVTQAIHTCAKPLADFIQGEALNS